MLNLSISSGPSKVGRGLGRLIATAALVILGPALAGAASPKEIFATSDEASTISVDHSAWDQLLKTYVKPDGTGLNRIDYAGFKSGGHVALKAYIGTLEQVDPTKLNRAEQFAYLANLYNAKTIDVVLDKYPVKSIKDISLGGTFLANITGGPWKAKVTTVNGVPFSLDDIEHGVMRPLFNDPRVHYAVNCASVGCPNLGTEAFTGAKLEAQLDAGARAFVNNPRGASVKDNRLVASSIYSWFAKDFGGNEAGVIAHLKKYAEPALAQQLAGISSVYDYEYDWTLNDTSK